jgi:hypothetical protein
MGSTEAPYSPAFPTLDPIIMDDEMESAFRNANMDFLDPTQLEMPSDTAGGDFDDLFSHVTNSRSNGAPETSKHYQNHHPLRQPPPMTADSPAESPDNSSRSSSSESPRTHLRQASVASTNSVAHSENPLPSAGFPSEDWMRPDLASVKEESPFTIEASYPMEGGFPDLESSNKAMDAAFDFESAASSPSPLISENTHQRNSSHLAKSHPWSPSSASAQPMSNDAAPAPSVSHFNSQHASTYANLSSRFMRPRLPSSLLASKSNLPSPALLMLRDCPQRIPNGADSPRPHFWRRVSEASI